jgi:hypothetical protein
MNPIRRALTGFHTAIAALLFQFASPDPAFAKEAMSGRSRLFEAYKRGMPLDSLYFLLAREAMGSLAYDTAMAFNLSVRTPAEPGPFRDSLLSQRHRLYVLSGLADDAARLKDSLPREAWASRREKRPIAWDIRFASAWSGETQGVARAYPTGFSIPGTDTSGADLKSRGNLSVPLPSPASLPLSVGLGYEAAKTYYKDSLDVRAEASLKADRILDRFSAAASAEAGRIAGVGNVAAAKAELTFMALAPGGFWLGDAGYEIEWEEFRDKRYDALWLSGFREWDLGSGRSLQGSLSASLVRLDPFRVPGMGNVIFVDDVSKSAPTHYRNGTFSDSLPAGSPITRFARYIEARDSTEFTCPQDALTLRPHAAFGWPLPGGFGAEVNVAYSFVYHPSPYRWMELGGAEPVPGDSVEFRGYALNRADGLYYRAFLDSRSGGMSEAYGSVPLVKKTRHRVDHRHAAGFSLRRPTRSFGSFTLDFEVERTFSTLSDRAPVWIPEWEYGVAFRWSLAGRKGAG